jgi:hypothetical protein
VKLNVRFQQQNISETVSVTNRSRISKTNKPEITQHCRKDSSCARVDRLCASLDFAIESVAAAPRQSAFSGNVLLFEYRGTKIRNFVFDAGALLREDIDAQMCNYLSQRLCSVNSRIAGWVRRKHHLFQVSFARGAWTQSRVATWAGLDDLRQRIENCGAVVALARRVRIKFECSRAASVAWPFAHTLILFI